VGLSQNQIYTYARQAGLSDAHAKTAAAIAMAESGGDPKSHNSTPPDDSYGLWQINMYGAMGPARRAIYHLTANDDLYDPVVNARVMSAISLQGNDFHPWTTYTSGKYKQFLNGVTDTSGTSSSSSSGGGGLLGVIDDAASVATFTFRASEALVKTAAWVSSEKNWLRVGYVALGGVAIVAGLVMVARTTGAGRTVTRVAAKQVKKAAKVAAVAA
jgi:hypothetical protein